MRRIYIKIRHTHIMGEEQFKDFKQIVEEKKTIMSSELNGKLGKVNQSFSYISSFVKKTTHAPKVGLMERYDANVLESMKAHQVPDNFHLEYGGSHRQLDLITYTTIKEGMFSKTEFGMEPTPIKEENTISLHVNFLLHPLIIADFLAEAYIELFSDKRHRSIEKILEHLFTYIENIIKNQTTKQTEILE